MAPESFDTIIEGIPLPPCGKRYKTYRIDYMWGMDLGREIEVMCDGGQYLRYSKLDSKVPKNAKALIDSIGHSFQIYPFEEEEKFSYDTPKTKRMIARMKMMKNLNPVDSGFKIDICGSRLMMPRSIITRDGRIYIDFKSIFGKGIGCYLYHTPTILSDSHDIFSGLKTVDQVNNLKHFVY